MWFLLYSLLSFVFWSLLISLFPFFYNEAYFWKDSWKIHFLKSGGFINGHWGHAAVASASSLSVILWIYFHLLTHSCHSCKGCRNINKTVSNNATTPSSSGNQTVNSIRGLYKWIKPLMPAQSLLSATRPHLVPLTTWPTEEIIHSSGQFYDYSEGLAYMHPQWFLCVAGWL